MVHIKNIFSYSILIIGVILISLTYPKQVGAATSATVVSTNLLSGVTGSITSINSFVYNLSAKPAGTTATVQFSQDGSTWKNSAGTVDGTNTLTTGTNNTISLSSLSWSGANFYYKIAFGGDGTNTPVLNDSAVTYTVFADCSSVPLSGNYSLAADCALPGTVNGIDAGTGTTNTAVLTTGAGTSLTVLSGQTIAVGSLSLTGGTVTIIDGGSMKIGSPIWMTDADSDGYPSATTQIIQASAPTNGRRRNLFTMITQADANDASACATNGASAGTCKTCLNGAPSNAGAGTDPNNDCASSYNACSGNNRIGPDGNCDGAGACNTGGLSSACSTAGTCQTGGGCSAGSCTAVSNVTAYNEGTGCTAVCTGCNGSGSCVNIANATSDTWGSNTTAAHYRCDGSGNQSAPTSSFCIGEPILPYSCITRCEWNGGWCQEPNAYESPNCTTGARTCNNAPIQGNGSCKCWRYVY